MDEDAYQKMVDRATDQLKRDMSGEGRPSSKGDATTPTPEEGEGEKMEVQYTAVKTEGGKGSEDERGPSPKEQVIMFFFVVFFGYKPCFLL